MSDSSWDDLRQTSVGLTGDDLLARLRQDQQRRWDAGTLRPAEQYLSAFPAVAADDELALTLIYGEALLRGADGDAPDVAEYRRRFPKFGHRLAQVFDLDAALSDTSIVGDDDAGDDWLDDDSIPGYTLLGEVGRGGMGVVFKALDQQLNRVVALKLVAAGALVSPARVERFRREAELAARISHQNVVPVYETGESAGFAYLAMEFVDGPTLAQHIAGVARPPAECAALVETLATAIAAAHERGVVHRDLKPANVMMSSEIPKLTDFGLARALDADVDLTATGVIVGTPCYMAPEQADGTGEALGPAVDIYALGAILYEMLVGQPPFRAATRMATLAQVRLDEPLPPRRLQPGVPRDLETICLKCLAKEPTRRYASAAALADDLRRFRAGEPIRARPVGVVGRVVRWARRNPGWATALGTAVALLAVIAGGASYGVVQLRAALAASEGHRQQAETARADADARRLESLLTQADSLTQGGRAGQRFRTLGVLADAGDLAQRLGRRSQSMGAIRNQAAAALALPDLWVRERWPGFPAGSVRVDVDPDFAVLARSDRQGAIVVERLDDRRVVARIPAPSALPPGPVYPVLAPGGRFVLQFWIEAGRAIGWDFAGEPTERFVVDGVHRFDFAPDGGRVALSHRDGGLSVFELPGGRLLQRFASTPVGPATVAWHPTGNVVALGSFASETVCLFDVDSGSVAASVRVPDHCTDLTWCPDGRTLAILDNKGTLRLRDGDDLRERRSLPLGRTAGMVSVTGELAAVNTTRGEMILVDLAGPRELVRHPAAHTPLMRPRFARDGRRLAIVAENGDLGFWQVADGREYRTFAAVDRRLYGLATHPTEPRLIALAASNGLAFWDVESGVELATIPGTLVARVAFEPNGDLLVTGPGGTFRRRITVEASKVGVGPAQKLPLPAGNELSVSRDGRAFACSCSYRELPAERRGVWVVPADGEPTRMDVGGEVRYVALSPDGRWLVTGREVVGDVNLWSVADRRLDRTLSTWGSRPTFSPDGQWLAIGGDAGRVLRVGDWAESFGFSGNGCFTADGCCLSVLSQSGGDMRLYDVATGRELVRLAPPANDGFVQQVFSADGAWLVATGGGAKASLHVWDVLRLRRGLTDLGLDWDAPPLAGGARREPFGFVVAP